MKLSVQLGIVLSGLGLCSMPVARAQSFAIGDTKEAVRHSFGTSPAFYSLPFDRVFPSDQEEFVAAAGQYHDVWEVKSSTNAFQVRLKYTPDATTSRLHPTERLQSVTITPDKNQSASALLEQIDPIRKLCEATCFVLASRPHSTSYLRLNICAKPETVSQTVAAGSYAGWNVPHEFGTYTICAIAVYGEHPELQHVALKNVVFEHLDPSYIRVTGELLEMLRKAEETYPLGTWTPKK